MPSGCRSVAMVPGPTDRATCLLPHKLSYPLSNFPSMNDKIRRGSALLEEGLAEFDPRTMTGDEAAKMVHLLSGVERVVVAAKARSARRVEETNLHRRQGHRDAAHWLASETGESAADAAGLLAAARQMEKLPQIEEAFRTGRLSPAKARQVAGAATCDPSKQAALLKAADKQSLGELRNTCDRVRRQATSEEDEATRYESMRRRRYLRTSPNQTARSASTAGSVPTTGRNSGPSSCAVPGDLLLKLAARSRERLECYLADALMELVSGANSGTGTGPEVHVTVDSRALSAAIRSPVRRAASRESARSRLRRPASSSERDS